MLAVDELLQDALNGIDLLVAMWPLHCFADREAAIHDLARLHTDPPRYASPLLLLTLLAHAARLSNRIAVQTSSSTDSSKMGGIFLARAKSLLFKQLDAPPTLPDTSAILMMASRQVACGSFTQAWVYLGMAIRMIEDMGITTMAASIASSANQLQDLQNPETRRAWRLFWSAFTFDKTVAFGLGRKPALTWQGEIKSVWLGQPTRDASPSWPEASQASTIHDPSGLKIPVMAATTSSFEASPDEPVFGRVPHYPYETFGNWCSLSALLGEILTLRTEADAQARLKALRSRLSQWRRDLPDHIAISDPSCEPGSRPPNIISLNMVYQICRILLHSSGRNVPAASEPMRIDNLVDSSPSCMQTDHFETRVQDNQVCRAAAIEIHALLEMWSRSYSFDRMTWLMGCCVYTAAVVNVHDVCHPDLNIARQAASRLNSASRALSISASFTPGIHKNRVNNGINATTPSLYSPAPWDTSEISPVDEELDQTSAIAKEAPRRQKRKANEPADHPSQGHFPETAKLHQGEWNLGIVDLDTMFKEVLEAESTHKSGHAANQITPPSQHIPNNPDMTTIASTSNMPALTSSSNSILWDNTMGASHWNLDALINDKELLDALGTLPLYPGDQL